MKMATTIMVLVTDMEDVFVQEFSVELNVTNVTKRVHFLIVIIDLNQNVSILKQR